MSKHPSRKERWVQVSATEYRSTFGVVRYRARAWEGTVLYEVRETSETQVSWRAETAPAGRFKRPRNAMIGVEQKAHEIRRRLGDQVKVAFED